MTTNGVLAIYCVLIVLASLAGGFVPLFVKLTHRRMQLAISFVAGLMLGIAVLHMLPHALMTIPAMSAARWLILGLLVMFFLERFFCFHHHDAPQQNPPVEGHDHDDEPNDHKHIHGHACSHTHDDGHGQSHEHRLGWYGAAVGLTVHSVINGVALAATMNSQTLSDIHGGGLEGWLPGLAVFLVIVLHKPFDSLTLGTLMAAGGRSVVSRHLVNGLFALAVPIGAMLFQLGMATTSIQHSTFVGATVAFSAGVFLVISLSDLLPELQFHHHDRAALSTALLLGVALAWAISHFEAGTHQHDDHADEHAAPAHHDDHAGHAH
jgi:zinc and cadmium transporter